MARVIKNVALVAVCLALIVPAVLLYTGALPYRIFVVHTGSMTPTIPSRSAVIVREGVYRVGQVISFESANGVVTHRLICREADGLLVTKGDANRTADPGQTRASQVIGGVVLAPREMGYWLVYLKNPAGAASVILTIVCVWLIFSVMGDLAERQTAKRRAMTMPSIANAVVPTATAIASGRDERTASPEAARPGPRPALVLGTEPPARVWKAVPRRPLVFRCSHCQATFGSDFELRLHRAERSHRSEGSGLGFPVPASLRKPAAVWSPPLPVDSVK